MDSFCLALYFLNCLLPGSQLPYREDTQAVCGEVHGRYWGLPPTNSINLIFMWMAWKWISQLPSLLQRIAALADILLWHHKISALASPPSRNCPAKLIQYSWPTENIDIINVGFNFKLPTFGVICYKALTKTPVGASQWLLSLLGACFPPLFLRLTLIQHAEDGGVMWKWAWAIPCCLGGGRGS